MKNKEIQSNIHKEIYKFTETSTVFRKQKSGIAITVAQYKNIPDIFFEHVQFFQFCLLISIQTIEQDK